MISVEVTVSVRFFERPAIARHDLQIRTRPCSEIAIGAHDQSLDVRKYEVPKFSFEFLCVVFRDDEHEPFELLHGAEESRKFWCEVIRWALELFPDENIDLQTSVRALVAYC